MNDRIAREKDFHNEVFGEEERSSRHLAQQLGRGIVDRPKEEAFQYMVQDLTPSRILDYGCGPGWQALRLATALKGADVVGIDISDVAVSQATRRAKEGGLTNASFAVMDAENLEFEDGAFDLVTGLGILHHLDLNASLKEIARVTAPSGKMVFVEPLAHNPLLRVFRFLTPSMRTIDEHPLTRGDFEIFRDAFDTIEIRFVNLFTLLAAPVPNLLARDPLIKGLSAIDKALFRAVPASRWWAWAVVIIGTKEHQGTNVA